MSKTEMVYAKFGRVLGAIGLTPEIVKAATSAQTEQELSARVAKLERDLAAERAKSARARADNTLGVNTFGATLAHYSAHMRGDSKGRAAMHDATRARMNARGGGYADNYLALAKVLGFTARAASDPANEDHWRAMALCADEQIPYERAYARVKLAANRRAAARPQQQQRVTDARHVTRRG